jgi:hypothetical protein
VNNLQPPGPKPMVDGIGRQPQLDDLRAPKDPVLLSRQIEYRPF